MTIIIADQRLATVEGVYYYLLPGSWYTCYFMYFWVNQAGSCMAWSVVWTIVDNAVGCGQPTGCMFMFISYNTV